MTDVLAWVFSNRETGQIAIAQWPNLSLGLFLAATAGRVLLDPTGAVRTELDIMATITLLWWAGDEIIRGVNPWRRFLGSVVLVAVVVGVVR